VTRIELRNVSLRNKGAELMLHAMHQHYRGRGDVELVANGRVAPLAVRRAMGIAPLLYAHRDASFVTTPTWLTPPAVCRGLGRVHPAEIDLVLDGAGFAYGDTWGPAKARNAARYGAYVRRHGGRTVLMPQSLGPFADAATADAMRALFDVADLVFARDDTAMAEMTKLVGASDRLVQCPDFTVLVHGEAPAGWEPGPLPAAIIPNMKMMQRGTVTLDAYVDFVLAVARGFADAGLTPFLLPHAAEDRDLIARIQARNDIALPVVREPDGLRLKGIIGGCAAAMSSRFHGLVSALCQGVPVVATGWSHKYRHLLSEYGCPDALVDPADDPAAMRAHVAAAMEPVQRATVAAVLRERAEWNRARAQQMWERIDALVAN
jgi:polysaccharide pyruvyl transferase WcaK-like protein